MVESIIFFTIGALILLLCIIFFVFAPQNHTNTRENVITLPISENLQKEIETLFRTEVQKSLEGLRKDIKQTETQILKSYQKELSLSVDEFKKDQKNYFDALKNATAQINQVLNEIEETTKEQIKVLVALNENIQEQLLQETDSKIDLTNKVIQKDLGEMHKKLLDLVNTFSQKTESLLQEVQRQAQDNVSRIPKQIEKSLEDYLAKARKEIDDYKEKRLRQLDEKVYLVLKKVAIAVLGKTIDLNQHQQIVKDALEKAKNEEFFN